MSGKVLDFFGDEVVNKAGEKLNTSSIRGEGKVIAVYFSAHWCPPCRMFTPKLAEFYNKAKANENGGNFELIFVSSDRDQTAFDGYLSEMPWWALPYERRDDKAKIARFFKVTGIPTLIILNGATGKILNKNGRAIVESDSEAKGFPWRARTLYDILKEGEYVDNKGKNKTFEDDIKGKVLGIYFSAHWCPPCTKFTPMLCKTYKIINSETKKFEVVFISSDQTEKAFTEYFNEMPFLALPYDSDLKEDLTDHFEVDGIPKFMIFDERGNLITAEGTSAIYNDQEGKKFPWVPRPVEELDEMSLMRMNKIACLIYFPAGDEESFAMMKDALKPAAVKFQNEAKLEDREPDLCFVVVNPDSPDSDMVSSLCEFIHHDKNQKLLAIIDIPSGKIYKFPDSDNITGLEQFARDFIDGKLQGEAIQ